ncbi:MAG: 16S rRNA (guanine(527)-N(7))-methyltransferase RsmG [Polyangia bacterium]
MNGQRVDAQLVAASAAAQDVDVDPGVLARLAAFGDLFLRWNERVNLGGRIGPRELVEQHFADSFAARRFVDAKSRVVDVGTGGGLPALPLALICPEVRVDLWEPTAKKVSFLRTAVRELSLGDRVTVNSGRMDAQSVGAQPTYDVATSRATFSPMEWLDMGLRLVRPGGRVLVFATGERPAGCPESAASYVYRDNRQILVFTRDS